ncbi:MAG: hypothetical protein AAF434_14850 [Pseudomonadota bacterium]
MRDDRHRWPATADFNAPIDLGSATLTPVPLTRQTLVSGPDVRAQINQALIGWPDIVENDSYAIACRRDRIMRINGPDAREGWDAANNQAISDASDAYAVFDLTGTDAMDLLKRGAEISLQSPSKSVARILFGLGVFLYRVGDKVFRLHVARCDADALVGLLKSAGKSGRSD